jgi:hypothetical protein
MLKLGKPLVMDATAHFERVSPIELADLRRRFSFKLPAHNPGAVHAQD